MAVSRTKGDLTSHIVAACRGDVAAREHVARTYMQQLRRRAHRAWSTCAGQQWLGPPTGCVSDALMRLFGQSEAKWRGSRHFERWAGRVVERVVIEAARRASASKRGGAERTDSDVEPVARDLPVAEALALRESLARVAALDPEGFRIAELHFLERRTHAEIGCCLGRTARSSERRLARFLERARRSGTRVA